MSKRHVVKQGESLPEIARSYGFPDCRVVWSAPDNSELRRKRPNLNVLHPGDVVTIPDAVGKTDSGKTGQTHTFQANRTERVLRLVMKDHHQKPLANLPYTIRFRSADPISGSTDGSGKIEKPMPPSSAEAFLDIAGRTYLLRFNHLNPMKNAPDQGMSGAQGRLKNLGYYEGPVNGVLDDATRLALIAFQEDFDLTADGKPGDPVFAKLESEHGS